MTANQEKYKNIIKIITKIMHRKEEECDYQEMGRR